MWFFLCIGGFVSPDHCLNWDESSELTGFPAMWQNFRWIVWELELNSLPDIDVTIFLFQIETKTNPGFCYFCPKQCIYLCMVLVVIMKDKILWILFRHPHLCICDFPILVNCTLKKLLTVKMHLIFLNYLENFMEIPFCFEISYSIITWEDGFKRKEVSSMKVNLYCEVEKQ